jgi:phosphoglycerol transferase MdoB-like AlkP superfamily enzyme
VTSGQGSSWRLSLPGQLPLAVIPLIALKLAGIIGWSWWWVLAPLWGSVVIFVALIGGLLLLLIRSQRPKI